MKLKNNQGTARVVGEFYEATSLAMIGGDVVPVNRRRGENPDILAACGGYVECKASGRNRWLIHADQLAYLNAFAGSRYLFWRYRYRKSIRRYVATEEGLREFLARNTLALYSVPAEQVERIARNDILWNGKNYWRIWQEDLTEFFADVEPVEKTLDLSMLELPDKAELDRLARSAVSFQYYETSESEVPF